MTNEQQPCIDSLIDIVTYAMRIAAECGEPTQVLLYDDEGIEGWRFLSEDDGSEWYEISPHDEPAPLHPELTGAIDAIRKHFN